MKNDDKFKCGNGKNKEGTGKLHHDIYINMHYLISVNESNVKA